jgi:hypothetical protein
MEGNGRVKYGTGDTDSLLPEHAEGILKLLYARHRGTFGALLAEVITGEKFTHKRVKTAARGS